MPSRRTHTKSRHGCIECKFRKVKCDETRPQCRRCSTRQTPCTYSEPFRSKNLIDSASPQPPISTLPNHVDPVPTAGAGMPQYLQPPFFNHNVGSGQSSSFRSLFPDSPVLRSTTSSVSGDARTLDSLRHRDMELLHHYTTSTHLTLHSNYNLREVWQITIPKLAFSNAYLLHGILCLSACHMAHNAQNEQDVEEFHRIAKYNYTTALSLFRPMLNHLDESNGPPVVSFAMLVILLAMAMPMPLPDAGDPDTKFDYVKYMIDNIRLIMGIKDVLSECWPFIRNTVIAPILAVDREAGKENLGFEAEVAMRCIEARIHSDIESPCLQEEYLEVVKRLRESNPRRIADDTEKHTIVLAWPAMIPTHFFQELDEKKPIAMAIFLFFGALLHNLNDIWWAGDKGKKLVEAVAEILPRGWESVIVWGKMCVGLPCDYTPLNDR